MKLLRPAFTIIEIIISVIIISFAIIFILKIHSDNHEHIVYISERNKRSLEDSLFLDRTVLRYHQNKKSAYTILEKNFKITNSKSIEILKNKHREIYIPEGMKIIFPQEMPPLNTTANKVMLKGTHSSIYYYFQI